MMVIDSPIPRRARMPVELGEGVKATGAALLAIIGGGATWITSVDLGKVAVTLSAFVGSLGGTAWGAWLIIDKIQRSRAATALEIKKNEQAFKIEAEKAQAAAQLEAETKREAAMAGSMAQQVAALRRQLAESDAAKVESIEENKELVRRLLDLRMEDHKTAKQIQSSVKSIEEVVRKDAKVLVVDDDQNTVDSMVRLLESEGFVVESATTLEDAKLKLSADTRVIVLDLQLRNESGWPLVKAIRHLEYNICIIICTGTEITTDEFLLHFNEHSPDHILTKPVDVAKLIELVKTCGARKALPSPDQNPEKGS